MFLDIVPDSNGITDSSLSGDCNLDEDNPVSNTVTSFCGVRSERDKCRKLKTGKQHSDLKREARFDLR